MTRSHCWDCHVKCKHSVFIHSLLRSKYNLLTGTRPTPTLHEWRMNHILGCRKYVNSLFTSFIFTKISPPRQGYQISETSVLHIPCRHSYCFTNKDMTKRRSDRSSIVEVASCYTSCCSPAAAPPSSVFCRLLLLLLLVVVVVEGESLAGGGAGGKARKSSFLR